MYTVDQILGRSVLRRQIVALFLALHKHVSEAEYNHFLRPTLAPSFGSLLQCASFCSVTLIIMDTNQDPIIFEAYKTLRNAIRKLELADSLGVIRAYMTNLQFNQNIPSDCQVHPDYYANGAAWVSEFHLETICREVVSTREGIWQGRGYPERLEDSRTDCKPS